MANAAAKTPAAGTLSSSILSITSCCITHILAFVFFLARNSTAATYKPILLGINGFYLLLRAAYWQQAIQTWQVIGTLTIWMLQYIAYQGILVDAAFRAVVVVVVIDSHTFGASLVR